MSSRRIERLNEQLRRELMDLLRMELRDPRVSSITVTRVRATPDLQQARVFVTTLAPESERSTIMEGLSAARPFLRSELARRLTTRRTPELTFEWDLGLDHARRIDELLARVRPAVEEDQDRADE